MPNLKNLGVFFLHPYRLKAVLWGPAVIDNIVEYLYL